MYFCTFPFYKSEKIQYNIVEKSKLMHFGGIYG